MGLAALGPPYRQRPYLVNALIPHPLAQFLDVFPATVKQGTGSEPTSENPRKSDGSEVPVPLLQRETPAPPPASERRMIHLFNNSRHFQFLSLCPIPSTLRRMAATAPCRANTSGRAAITRTAA